MKTKIAKNFDWEMSHRLPDHKGLCRNIHGHSYKMRVELEGEPNSQSMVIDYYDMKLVVSPLLEKLDHCFACEASDSVMINFLKKNDFKHVVFDFHTTAENLAVYFLDELAPLFKKYDNINKLTVRICETVDVFAEVSRAV
ncbi:MAG: 6-carboxytetrahydropterin synthase [Chlorobi bacterium]|nr:6-carboxytetrahydropterin synthase [Chlorobiota bacterium]